MILAPQPTISCNTGSFIHYLQDPIGTIADSVDHIIQSIPFSLLAF